MRPRRQPPSTLRRSTRSRGREVMLTRWHAASSDRARQTGAGKTDRYLKAENRHGEHDVRLIDHKEVKLPDSTAAALILREQGILLVDPANGDLPHRWSLPVPDEPATEIQFWRAIEVHERADVTQVLQRDVLVT